jgi:hypothetical protein
MKKKNEMIKVYDIIRQEFCLVSGKELFKNLARYRLEKPVVMVNGKLL